TQVSNFAARTNSGTLVVSEADDITIGTVDGLSGITTVEGTITLTTANGDITIAQNVSADAADINFTAGTASGGHRFTNRAVMRNIGPHPIPLQADAFDLQPGSALTCSLRPNQPTLSGEVDFRASSAGISADLGSTGAGFALSQAELDTITAEILR